MTLSIVVQAPRLPAREWQARRLHHNMVIVHFILAQALCQDLSNHSAAFELKTASGRAHRRCAEVRAATAI
jgi:hypothetical protein